MTSTLPPLTQALTGALGGAVANSLVYPLDLACARVQTLSPKERKHLGTGLYGGLAILRARIKERGPGALYDGIESDTAATLLSNFLYFYAYSLLRYLALRRRARSAFASDKSTTAARAQVLPVALELALGFVAGVASRAVSTPLSVITVRLQTESSDEPASDEDKDQKHSQPTANVNRKRATALTVLQSIYDSDGLAGFWKGFDSTVLLSLNPALTFAFFQVLHRILARISNRPAAGAGVAIKPGPLEAFFGAATSNCLAVAILYPLMLAKTRTQAAIKDGNDVQHVQPRSTFQALLHVLRHAYGDDNRGINGLYQGLQVQLVKGFFNQGVSFLVKERIEQTILLLLSRRQS